MVSFIIIEDISEICVMLLAVIYCLTSVLRDIIDYAIVNLS